jgi:hypothetical protein
MPVRSKCGVTGPHLTTLSSLDATLSASVRAALGSAIRLLIDRDIDNDVEGCAKLAVTLARVAEDERHGEMTPDDAARLRQVIKAWALDVGCGKI